MAEQIAPEDSETRQDIGRLLIARKDYPGAMEELKQAEAESEPSWQIHELYAQALMGGSQTDLAIGEFKEAIALDASQSKVKIELGTALEKKGDWPAGRHRRANLRRAFASLQCGRITPMQRRPSTGSLRSLRTPSDRSR